MIEIASPATPQLSSLLPPCRRRSLNDAPGASREHGRREKYDPIAARGHSLATLYPSKSSLMEVFERRPCLGGQQWSMKVQAKDPLFPRERIRQIAHKMRVEGKRGRPRKNSAE